MSPIWLGFLKYILTAIQWASVAGTFIIPVFFGNKITKSHHNYIAPNSLSIRKRLSQLDSAGILFIICIVLSIILTYITTTIANNEIAALAKQNSDSTIAQNKRNFDTTLKIQLQHASDINELKEKYKDSLNKKESEIQELNRIRQVNKVQFSVNDVKSQLATKSFQFDTLSIKLQQANKENLQLQKILNSPVIEALPENFNETEYKFNPHLYKDSVNNFFWYSISYVNSGKGNAINLRTSSYIIYNKAKTGKLEYQKYGDGTYDDKTLILREGGINGYIIKIYPEFMKLYNLSDFGIAIEVKYKNSFGEEREPFRNIYLVDTTYKNQHIRKIPKIDKEAYESFLKSNKIWND